MAALLLKLVRKINNGESFEWALFDADAAPHAEGFYNERLLILKSNRLYPTSYWGAKAIAYPTTTLWFASILIEHSNPNHGLFILI